LPRLGQCRRHEFVISGNRIAQSPTRYLRYLAYPRVRNTLEPTSPKDRPHEIANQL
jgi:hypothetical protein